MVVTSGEIGLIILATSGEAGLISLSEVTSFVSEEVNLLNPVFVPGVPSNVTLMVVTSGEETLFVIYSPSLMTLPEITGSGMSSNVTSMVVASEEIGLITLSENASFVSEEVSLLNPIFVPGVPSNITLMVVTSGEETLFVIYSPSLMTLPEITGSGMSSNVTSMVVASEEIGLITLSENASFVSEEVSLLNPIFVPGTLFLSSLFPILSAPDPLFLL